MRHWRLLLVLIAVISFGVALSYPIMYRMAEHSNNTELENLSDMRAKVLSEMGDEGRQTRAPRPLEEAEDEATPDTQGEPSDAGEAPDQGQREQTQEPGAGATGQDQGQAEAAPTQTPAQQQPGGTGVSETPAPGEGGETAAQTAQGAPMVTEVPTPTPTPTPVPTPTPTLEPGVTPSPTPGLAELMLEYIPLETPPPFITPTPSPVPTDTPVPTPTVNRFERTDALSYTSKEKVKLDEDKILPELRAIYEINHDMVGWICIPDTVIDYPVVQSEDREFYLKHDFYGNKNNNGQIILDEKCDPYTPSYNLIISGHRMNNGSMFAGLAKYQSEKYWQEHKYVQFDTLMSRGDYVIFAAFYSADYDQDEEGFRYNADIRYRIDAEQWLEEIKENQIYDTGIDAKFGDEFITLTTCNYSRRNGRFVLVCRKLREGEKVK